MGDLGGQGPGSGAGSGFGPPGGGDTRGGKKSGKKARTYDKRTKYARVKGTDARGALIYSHVAPPALDWNQATDAHWNPFLATTDQPTIGNTSQPKEDATRVYVAHRARDADRVHAGSLNDVLLLPCRVHAGGNDEDGNPIHRLMIGFDKAEFYADDDHHGTIAHRFTEKIPPEGTIPVKTWFYYHPPTHKWRLKTAVYGGGGGPEPDPKTPGTPPPPSTPSTPTTPTTPSPGGGTQPTGGGTTPLPGTQPTSGGTGGTETPGPVGGSTTSGGGKPDGPFPKSHDPGAGNNYAPAMMEMRMEESTERGNQVAQTSPYHNANLQALRGTARLSLSGRSQLGPPRYTAGVEGLQASSARSWMGRGRFVDPAIIAAQLTGLDWTAATVDTTTKYTQAEADSLHPYSERTSYAGRFNALSDHIQDLNAQFRSNFSEAFTVTISAGAQTTTVTTTYAVATPAVSDLKVVATPVDSKTVIDTTSFTLNADNTVTVTIQITGTPVTDTEVSVILSYPIARSVTLTASV